METPCPGAGLIIGVYMMIMGAFCLVPLGAFRPQAGLAAQDPLQAIASGGAPTRGVHPDP